MTTPPSGQTVRTHAGPAGPGAGLSERPLLRIEDLSVSFAHGKGKRVMAADGVRLSVYPRQTVAVVGESGCGKSVTAMSVLQLVPRPPARFERGHAWWRGEAEGGGEGGAGRDLLAMSPREIREVRGREIAMIFQEPMTSLNPVYTVGEQVTEAVRLHREGTRAEANRVAVEAMAEVGIPEPERRMRSYPHQFSGGMRQRVMIAMALACRPRLLLADEPTTALDVTIQAQILALLRRLRRERGMGVVLITHDLGVVAENADVVCVMYAGRVVEYTTVTRLFERPLHPYTRGLLACVPGVGGERRERLFTISEAMRQGGGGGGGGEGGGEGLGEPVGGSVPWWPWSPPTRGLVHALREVEPDHWVGVWDPHDRRDVTPPDLLFRREDAT